MTPRSDFSDPKKSTIVRSRSTTEVPFRLRAIRAGIHALEAGSPALAARVGEQIMFSTTRRPPRPEEKALLAQGERLTVRGALGNLTVWRFGRGPVIVLVHGWNGRAGQLGGLVEPLVSSGYSVVMFDAPGHGESEGSHSSLPDFADAFDAVLDAVIPIFGRAHAVIAHPMGGAAVTYAVSRYQRRHETLLERGIREIGQPVERFVFIAPPIDVRDFVRGFSHLVGLRPDTEEALNQRLNKRFDVPMADLYGPDLAKDMNAPLLVLHDADDREVPLRCGQLLAEAWPHATLEVTHGLGHNRILRDPGVLRRVVAAVSSA